MKQIMLLLILISSKMLLLAQNEPKLSKTTIKEVVVAMTTEEKAHLLVGNGMKMPGAQATFGATMDKVPGAAGTTFAIPRLGIPSIVVADGPAGLRIQPTREDNKSQTFYCTAFPVATLLASSWDTDLVQRAGEAMGNEVLEYGVDVLLGPGMNIHRNALGGRNFEYYSEDPLVSGKMAAAMVKGIQSNGVGTSVKHFAGNNQETNRNLVNTIASERALREIYLKGFEIVVKEAKPWTVMSSYNKINGIYASQSQDLLTKILRNDWKYEGFVMTDWFGGDNAVEQVRAGNDLIMPGMPSQFDAIMKAVKDGSLDEKLLDLNVARMLNIIVETPSFKGYKYSNKPHLKKHAEIARSLAAEGMILLKNDKNTLPLKQKSSVAILGKGSYEFISGGTGSGDVNEAYTVSLPEGLTNAGFSVNTPLKNDYENYVKTERGKQEKPKFFFFGAAPINEMSLSSEQLKLAQNAQTAIITISRNSGEFVDRKKDVDFELSTAERNLIKTVSENSHKNGKKVVVILNVGGAVEIASWRDYADAILLAWEPGQEAGNAVADILSGKVSPSGKLATSLPLTLNDEASAKNFPGKELDSTMIYASFGFPLGKKSEVTYEEGIFVGYRYDNTFKVKTAYDFGFGKSYTTFTYNEMKVNKAKDGSFTASVKVTNSGKMAGKEVAQLYVSAPAKTLDKPESELKGFAKTKLLKAGESQILTFKVSASDLASFDTNLSTWVTEAGIYEVKIAASSTDIRKKATFNQATELRFEKVSKSLVPQVPIKEITTVKRP
jgi:beta-glucosidase